MTDDPRNNLPYRCAGAIALVATAFCLAVGMLLVVNAFRAHRADALNSPAVEQMSARARSQPETAALREAFQALDVLARQAHFTSVAFMRTGSLLLLLGGVVLGLCIQVRVLILLRRPLPQVGEDRPSELTKGPRRALLAAALVLGALVVAGLVAFTRVQRRRFDPAGAAPATADASLPARWPMFRGPGGSGIAATTNAPVKWDGTSGLNILWKAAVPAPGFSSPIVWGDRLFLSGATAERLQVFCYALGDGTLLWTHEVIGIPGSPPTRPEVTEDTGHAAATMTGDGERVFAVFATGDVVALDVEGQRVWARNLGVPDNMYGHASSLVVYGKGLIVQLDHGGGGSVRALDTATGAPLWRTARETDTTWSSPIVATVAGRDQLILNGNPTVAAYDPRNGARLWAVDCMGGEVAVSPAAAGELVYVGNAYACLAAIRPGDGAEIVWQVDEGLPDVASPLATGRRLYTATGWGGVTCRNRLTGAELWSHEFDDGFYSSPTLVGDRVYLMDRKGVMHIFRDADTYEPLGTCPLGEPATCSPAFVDDRVYIRGMENLYCVGG